MSLAVFAEGRLAQKARELGMAVHCIPKRFRGDPLPLWRLRQVIRRHRVNVVHTHMISGNVYGRIAARLVPGTVLITTLHYIDRDALPFLPPLLQRLFFDGDIRMSEMCDRIITTSKHMYRQLVDRGLTESKLVNILNGIDVDSIEVAGVWAHGLRSELGVERDVPIVGIVGRLVPVKNHALFLRVARRVIDRGARARFVIVGDGPLREPLRALSRELGLDEHVVFTGFRSDVMRLLTAFDVCVLTSNSETSAYGVSEPMAAGRPVVATAVGGIPELIDQGVDGWLCPPHDAAALADKVCALLENPAEAARMGERAARKVREQLSLDRMLDQTEDLYREAVFERFRHSESPNQSR